MPAVTVDDLTVAAARRRSPQPGATSSGPWSP